MPFSACGAVPFSASRNSRMPSPRSIVRSGRDDGEGLAHHGRNKSRNSTHARRNSSGGASPDASHRLQQSNGNGPLTGSLYTFYEDSLLTDDEARLTEAEPDDASSSEEAEEKVEQLATESKKRFSDPGGLLAGLPGMVRRILVLCGSPFIFAWRLMVSACLLAEMMLSVVLHRLGVETTAQAQVPLDASDRRQGHRSFWFGDPVHEGLEGLRADTGEWKTGQRCIWTWACRYWPGIQASCEQIGRASSGLIFSHVQPTGCEIFNRLHLSSGCHTDFSRDLRDAIICGPQPAERHWAGKGGESLYF